MPSCSENGIMGAVTGVMGSLQAAEVTKEILSIGESLAGYLLRVNLLNLEFRRVTLPPDPECKLCGNTH
jgi:adenylyltransferase/sulfurtransferase